MHSRTVMAGVLGVTALLALLCLPADAAIGSPLPLARSMSRSFSTSPRSMHLMSSLRAESDDGGDDDKHGDPDAFVPAGDVKAEGTTRLMTCEQARDFMSLRGGGDGPVAPAGEGLQIIFVSAEIAPWSITGGLGAVSDQQRTALVVSVMLSRTDLRFFCGGHRVCPGVCPRAKVLVASFAWVGRPWSKFSGACMLCCFLAASIRGAVCSSSRCL